MLTTDPRLIGRHQLQTVFGPVIRGDRIDDVDRPIDVNLNFLIYREMTDVEALRHTKELATR